MEWLKNKAQPQAAPPRRLLKQQRIPAFLDSTHSPKELDAPPSNVHRRQILLSPFAALTDSSMKQTPPATNIQRDPTCFSDLPIQGAPFLKKSGLPKRPEKFDPAWAYAYLKNSLILRVVNNQIFYFQGPCWHRLDDGDAEALFLDVLEKAGVYCYQTYSIQNLRKRLALDIELRHKGQFVAKKGCINFLDGTLDLLSETFYDHRPSDCFSAFVNCSYEEIQHSSCSGEVFENFVRNFSGGNPAVRQQVLELIAVAVSGVQLKSFFVLLGPSHSGKTQLGRFLVELLGEEQAESITDIGDFEKDFTVGPLAGKRLVTCLDLPDAIIPARAVSILKQLVGDDPVKGQLKHKNAFTFYQKPLLLLAGNHPLRLQNKGKERAFLNRMVTIPFANSCPPELMRQQLYDDLVNETPYILGQAISAFQTLKARNFQLTRADIPEEYRTESYVGEDPIRIFLTNCCVEMPDAEIKTRDLWSEYADFAVHADLPSMNEISFSRAIAQTIALHYPHVKSVKRVGKTDQRGFRGIQLANLSE